jgi:hypothetical protein
MNTNDQILDDHVARRGNTRLDFTKVATGILSFTGALVCQSLLVYLLIVEKIYKDSRPSGLLLWVGFTLVFVSVMYYTVITRFWSARIAPNQEIDLEERDLAQTDRKRAGSGNGKYGK